MFTLSIQREIGQFHVVVGGCAVKEMCKKLDACLRNIATLEPRGNWTWLNFSKTSWGAFQFNENFRKFGSSGTWYRILPQKFLDIPEIVKFPKRGTI